MRYARLTRLKRDLHGRRLGLLAVKFLGDVPLRECGHFRLALVGLIVSGEGQPAEDEEEQGRKGSLHGVLPMHVLSQRLSDYSDGEPLPVRRLPPPVERHAPVEHTART